MCSPASSFFFVFLSPTSFDIVRLMIARPRVHTARVIAAAIESVICNSTKYFTSFDVIANNDNNLRHFSLARSNAQIILR